MKRPIFLLAILFFSVIMNARQVVNLKEGKSFANNGLEYGYYISNEGSKEVKGEDFDRFEINLTVTNNSGCIKLIPFKTGYSGSTTNEDDILIAEFNCTNATGKRLTSKKGTIAGSFTCPKYNKLCLQRKYQILLYEKRINLLVQPFIK